MEKEQKIKAIHEKIARNRNVGNENEGDFLINEVMIGDVLDCFQIKPSIYCKGGQQTLFNILNYWKKKRFPIEEQSEECIDYIYNLIK